MNKSKIILLVVFMAFSCGKKDELPINRSQFQNKTFSLFSKSKKDTLIIEFQDSTHQIYGDMWQGKIPWRISNYGNTNFLVLDNRVIGIKRINKSKIECTYIGLSDNFFVMAERKPKWNKEQIYGTWIEEKFIGTDSANFPPPIEPSNEKWNWPPNYTINKNKIELDFYEKFESEIEINNSGEFILMDLKNSNGLGTTEELWQIKYLSDSLMIVDKSINDILLSHGENKMTDIKLIKEH